jgi:hypothetical protein
MNQSQFNKLQCWFNDYVKPFCDTDPDGLRNIQLKIDHTARVCKNMEILAQGEKLSTEDRLIAATIALLHDVGRFSQYHRWRTFLDSKSDNHARLSIDVIREQRILDLFDPIERLIIEEAVRFHNLLALPQQMKSPTTLFLRLIRDADKLDIWRVFLEYLTMPVSERASAAMPALPELPGVSPACLQQLAAGSIVRLDTLTCINDYLLLLASWVYDLNFSSSCRLVIQYDFLGSLARHLPERDDIKAALHTAREHIALKTGDFSP